MKTLLVTEVFPPKVGGSGRWFWEIYRRLPRPDFLIAAGQDPTQIEFDRTHDLRLVREPLAFSTWGLANAAGLRQYTRMAWRLRGLIRTEGVDVLHAGKCLPEGLLAWLLRTWSGIPYACYVHGEELNLARGSRELAWWTRRVLRGAGLVIANSHNTARLLTNDWQLRAEHLKVLHPGVDTTRFVPAARDPELRARLGWGERPVVLTVGRLQKRKGQDQMIRALAAIRQVVPEVLYAIVGDGEEYSSLQKLVAEERAGGHTQFLGELTDEKMVVCYQQCDLFVLPNRQVDNDIEGFGMVLVEAQACGKPVIAGASGGTAETMHIPKTGVVVPCEGPDQLANLVVQLLTASSRLKAMGQAARAWVVDHFDWQELSRQAQELFQSPLPGLP